jgi:hypothetical protein
LRQINLTRFFTKTQITYLQGAAINADLKVINRQASNKARDSHRVLEDLFDFEGDTLKMPWIVIMYSPFYKAVVLEGDEAFEALNLFKMLGMAYPPKSKPEFWNIISKDIIRMILGQEPVTEELKEYGFYDIKKKSISMTTKRRLHLEKEIEYFRQI